MRLTEISLALFKMMRLQVAIIDFILMQYLFGFIYSRKPLQSSKHLTDRFHIGWCWFIDETKHIYDNNIRIFLIFLEN